MPYLKLTTNAPALNDKRPALLRDLSKRVAQETGKPERYVMVELVPNADMLFGGSDEVLAYLECKSIGLNSRQAKTLSAAISQILTAELQVAADRIYIEFTSCPAEFWGWNGTTFG